MYVRRLRIRNFKSFYNLNENWQFAPTTNLICGLNGQGKSNILRALNFLADPLFMSRPVAQRDSYRAKTSESNEFIVEAELRTRPQAGKHQQEEEDSFSEGEEEKEEVRDMLISREYSTTSKTCKYMVNGFEVSPYEYFSAIEKNGFWTQSSFANLAGTHPSKIATLKTSEIMLLLEEIHGGEGFEKLKRAIDKELIGLVKVREKLEDKMNMFHKFKGDVSGKRTLLKKQAELEKYIDMIKKVRTSKQVDEIQSILEKQSEILYQKQEKLNRKLEEEGELDKLHQRLIKDKQQKMNEETRYNEILETEDSKIKGEQVVKIVLDEAHVPPALIAEAVKYSERRIKEQQKELRAIDDNVESRNHERGEMKKKWKQEKKEIEREENTLEKKNEELQSMKQEREKAAQKVQKLEMATIQFSEQDIKKKSAYLKSQIATINDTIKAKKKEIREVEAQTEEVGQKLKNKNNQRRDLLVEQERLKQALDHTRKEERQCEEDIIGIVHRVEKLEPKIHESETAISKQFSDFKDARRALECLDQKSAHHYGLFLDCLEVSNEFKTAFERIMGLRALCAIVTHKPRSIFRKLKDERNFSRITVINTELCRVMKRSEEIDIERSRDMHCTRLLDGVRIKKQGIREDDREALQNMLKARLGHVVIAPSELVALRCSKECNTTCIVRNSLEVFSEEGSEVETYGKGGLREDGESLMHLYEEMRNIDKERKELVLKREEIERRQKELSTKENDLKVKVDAEQVKVNSLDYTCKMLEKEREMLQTKREEILRDIEQEQKAKEKAIFELEGVKALTVPEKEKRQTKKQNIGKLQEDLKLKEERVKQQEQEIKEAGIKIKGRVDALHLLEKEIQGEEEQIEVMKVMRGGVESTLQALKGTLREIVEKREQEDEPTRAPDSSGFDTTAISRIGGSQTASRRKQKKYLQLSTTAEGMSILEERGVTIEGVHEQMKSLKIEIREMEEQVRAIQADIGSQSRELQTIMAQDPLQCHRAIREVLNSQRQYDQALGREEKGDRKEIRIDAAGLTLKLKIDQIEEIKHKLKPFLDERKRQRDVSQKDLQNRVENLERDLEKVRRDIESSENLPQKIITSFDRMEGEIEEFYKSLRLDELERSVEQAYKALGKINHQRIDNLILGFKKLNRAFSRFFKYFEPLGKAEVIIQRVPGITKGGQFREGAIYEEMSPDIAKTMLDDYQAELIQGMEVDSLRSRAGLELMRGDDYHTERNQLQKAIEQRIGKMGSHITSLLNQTQAASKKTDLEDEIIEMEGKRADGEKLVFRKRRMNYLIKICVQFSSTAENVKRSNSQDNEAMQRYNEIAMLSGGQQTIIGLCMHHAFAQMLDVPKMMILDEPDASLDYTYRAAFADLVKRNKPHNQYFVITFRPDLIPTMDKFFEVHYFGRYSQMRETNESAAYNVILEALKEEEKKKLKASDSSPVRLKTADKMPQRPKAKIKLHKLELKKCMNNSLFDSFEDSKRGEVENQSWMDNLGQSSYMK